METDKERIASYRFEERAAKKAKREAAKEVKKGLQHSITDFIHSNKKAATKKKKSAPKKKAPPKDEGSDKENGVGVGLQGNLSGFVVMMGKRYIPPVDSPPVPPLPRLRVPEEWVGACEEYPIVLDGADDDDNSSFTSCCVFGEENEFEWDHYNATAGGVV